MTTLSSRERVVLMSGAALVAVVAMTFGVARPGWRVYSHTAERLASQGDMLEREERTIAGTVAARNRLRALSASADSLHGKLGTSRTTTTAAMQLASWLRTIAGENELLGVRCLDAGSDSVFRDLHRVRVQVEGRGDFQDIALFITALEASVRPLTIDDLEIAADGSSATASASASGNAAAQLRFRAVIASLAIVRPIPKSGVRG